MQHQKINLADKVGADLVIFSKECSRLFLCISANLANKNHPFRHNHMSAKLGHSLDFSQQRPVVKLINLLLKHLLLPPLLGRRFYPRLICQRNNSNSESYNGQY